PYLYQHRLSLSTAIPPHGRCCLAARRHPSTEGRRHAMHVTTPFGDIAYRERGSGAAALFVHGVSPNGPPWPPAVERVADVPRCIAVDLLAHGDTRTAADQDVSFPAQAEMLEAFCAALGLDQVDLVANDSGTAIAQLFAAHHPGRIRSLTLTNGDVHDHFPPPAGEPLVAAARG